jgi:hypothetical protein
MLHVLGWFGLRWEGERCDHGWARRENSLLSPPLIFFLLKSFCQKKKIVFCSFEIATVLNISR